MLVLIAMMCCMPPVVVRLGDTPPTILVAETSHSLVTYFLSCESPIARATDSTPLTRHAPYHTTTPPSSSIRDFSSCHTQHPINQTSHTRVRG
jgi:hypothetical protein